MSQLSKERPHIGPYAVQKELFHDGLGVLYLAHNEQGTPFLVRVIAPELANGENFSIRFELLKPLLPTIAHDHLIRVREMGQHKNAYYIAYTYPGDEEEHLHLNLEEYQAQNHPLKGRAKEQLFLGLARGLLALRHVRDHFYKEGIPHTNLHPTLTFIREQKGAFGGPPQVIPLIWGFAEPFLFFGDRPDADLRYRMARTPGIYDSEWLYPAESRYAGGDPTQFLSSFTLGQLIYTEFTGHPIRGFELPLSEQMSNVDPIWEKILEVCLAEKQGTDEERLKKTVELLTQLQQRRVEQAPVDAKVQEIEIPDGMTLVSFDDKVELGASDGPPEEQPAFRAKLKPFLIDLCPVTVEQFQKFLGTYQPSSFSRFAESPATQVSWHLAKAYCRWRAEKEGLHPESYRLPTEYEWEAACRGSQGVQYPWGETWQHGRAHVGRDKEYGACKVKGLAPGRFGIYGMIGNVWEWTESIFKPHPYSEHQDPRYERMLYVVKGGCWYTKEKGARASLRAAFSADDRRAEVGFRCVRLVE